MKSVLLALGCALAVPAAALATQPKPSPPVIKETFTLLPCPGKGKEKTTLDLQGCAEHEILRTDKLIDAKVKAIFPLLHSDAARVRFVGAQQAWLRFRRSDCSSASDVYEGGSLAAVEFANCVVDRNVQRLKELRTFEQALRPR